MLHLLETQLKEANTRACQQRISLPTDDTQSNVSEIYADNLDAICILFMCFPPEKSHLDGKTDSDKTTCYLFTESISPIREAFVLLPS